MISFFQPSGESGEGSNWGLLTPNLIPTNMQVWRFSTDPVTYNLLYYCCPTTRTNIVETNIPHFSKTNIGPAKRIKHFLDDNGIFIKFTFNSVTLMTFMTF